MELLKEDYVAVHAAADGDLSGSSFEEQQPQASLVTGTSIAADDIEPLNSDTVNL